MSKRNGGFRALGFVGRPVKFRLWRVSGWNFSLTRDLRLGLQGVSPVGSGFICLRFGFRVPKP